MTSRDSSLVWLALGGAVVWYLVTRGEGVVLDAGDGAAQEPGPTGMGQEGPETGDGAAFGDGWGLTPSDILSIPQNVENAVGSLLSSVRGIRNNNPGNIRRSGIAWQGMAPTQTDPAFVQFADMASGVRAMAKILTTYASRGLRSPQAIISKWAPPVENDTGAYVRAVAADLGVDIADDLDLHDPSTMAALVRAIIKHENGRVASALVSDATIFQGVSMALNS